MVGCEYETCGRQSRTVKANAVTGLDNLIGWISDNK